jgi:hypothetical protein
VEVEKINPNINVITQHLIKENLKPIPATSKEEVNNLSTYKEKGRIIDIKA